jgi:hypothetical protein
MRFLTHEAFLQRTDSQVEAQLEELISIFQNVPEAQLRVSSQGGWSPAECLEHLNTYAVFYLPRIQKGLERSPQQLGAHPFKHSFLGRYFIDAMDASRSRKKFKAMKKHRPVEVSQPHAVVGQFIQHMEELLSMVRQAQGRCLSKVSVSTSISPLIKISVGDAIQFLLTHNHRHLLQAPQALNA